MPGLVNVKICGLEPAYFHIDGHPGAARATRAGTNRTFLLPEGPGVASGVARSRDPNGGTAPENSSGLLRGCSIRQHKAGGDSVLGSQRDEASIDGRTGKAVVIGDKRVEFRCEDARSGEMDRLQRAEPAVRLAHRSRHDVVIDIDAGECVSRSLASGSEATPA